MEFDLQMIQLQVATYGIKIVAAAAIFIIGKWLAGRITHILSALLEKQKIDLTLVKFLNNILYYVILAAVVVAAAGQLGINTASFLTIIGAASLAIGLALKDSLSNFSSGVMLILFRPFRVGDVITAAGQTGKVEEISIFSTIMSTGDNQRLIIPNGAIANATITNITANPTRRVDLVVGISYDDDISKAKELLQKIVSEDELVLKEPAAAIAVSALGESSVDLVVRPWVKTGDYWTVYFNLTEKIKLSFDENNISFPYPQRDVHLYAEEARA